MVKEKWVTRDYLVAWAASFLISANFYLGMVSTSGYAIDSFGASSALAGFAASVYVFAAIFSRIIAGRHVFRVGCRRMLTIGLAGNVPLSLCYLFADSIWILVFIRILHGLLLGIASTSVYTIASVLIPKGKSGVGMGYFSLSATLATAVSPFLAAALTRAGSYTALFAVLTVIAVLDLCFIPFLRLKNANLPDPATLAKPPKGLAGILDTQMLPVALICGVAYSTYGCIVAFLSVSSRGTGLATAAAFFFIFYAAGILAARPFAGRCFDRYGENPVMYAGLAVYAAGLLLTGLAGSGPMLLLAAFLNGSGIGSVQAVTLSIGVKYAPPERLGMANSTYYIFLDAGLTVGPILGGLLVPFIGYAGIYMLGSPLALCGIVLYYFIHGRSHRRARTV